MGHLGAFDEVFDDGHVALPARVVDGSAPLPEREFFIDNLLVRIHFIIVMIRWTGLAPWEFEFPFPGSPTSTFLGARENCSSCSEERCLC